MFNPFKKKDNSFKLDEYSVPSMSDEAASASPEVPQTSASDTPEMPPIQEESYQQVSSEPFPNQNNFQPVDPSLAASSFEQQNNSMNQMQQVDNTGHDLTKAKLESLESKTALMDARLSSIEQKLEIIYQMLAAEVSEETRQKLHVQSMLENAKFKNQ